MSPPKYFGYEESAAQLRRREIFPTDGQFSLKRGVSSLKPVRNTSQESVKRVSKKEVQRRTERALKRKKGF